MSYEDMSRAEMLEAEAGHLVETIERLTRERATAQAEVERLRQLLWRRCGQCGMEGCLIVGDAIDNMPAGQARKFEEAKRGRA